MDVTPCRIETPAGSVSALWSGPEGGTAFVYAPGAGSSLNDPFGAFAAKELSRHGVGCLRFQFPYSEAGRKVPDRAPVLEATWIAALALARTKTHRVIAGGRSMGGRIASHVVAAGAEVAGLALFAYPLHPPGRPDQRRDSHLADIQAPTLFCSGDRDTFGTVEELKQAAALVPDARLHVLEGADHGFAVLKASGRRREDVWQEAVGALLLFLQTRLPQ